MRDRHDDFEKAGAGVAAIGMGTSEMAASFAASRDIPFPLLVDKTRVTYRALDIKKGSWSEVIGPKVWTRYLRALREGHSAAVPRQDPKQLGGALVIAPGGEVKYVHKATNSSDIAPVEELLAALG